MGRNRRLRMKEWLRQLLENGSVSGLCWEDRNHGIFKIDWKHGSQHGYSIDKDAVVFRMWAEHTGKYSVGDPCDPKRWKANFRCALNSLKDVIQLPDRTTVRGANAYRLYLFENGGLKCKKRGTSDTVHDNINFRRRKVHDLNLEPVFQRTTIKTESYKSEMHFSSSYQPNGSEDGSSLPYTLNCYQSRAPTEYYVSRSPVHYEPLTPESDVACNQTTTESTTHFDYSSELISGMLKSESSWNSCSEWQIAPCQLAPLPMNDCNGGIDINLPDEFEMLPTEFRLGNDEEDSNHDELMHFVKHCLSNNGDVDDPIPNGWKI